MAEPGFTHVIEIENGIGEPPYLPLTLGVELAPVSVGKEGMWQIQAPSVLDVHGYLYYDGASLFVQSADGERPILVDASEVGTSWTSVEAPCRLKLGDVYLRFRTMTDEEVESRRFNADDATLVRPDPPVQLEDSSQSAETIAMPEPPVKPPRPFQPGELVIRNYDDSASTQVADLVQPPPGSPLVSGGDTTGATLVRGRVADETKVERTTSPPRRRIAPAPPKPPPGTKSPLARPRAPSMPVAAPPMPMPAPPLPPPLAPDPMYPPAPTAMTHAMAPARGIYPPLPPVDPTAVMAPPGPPPTVPPPIQSVPGSPYAPMHPPAPQPRPEPGLNTLMGEFRRFSPVKKAAILAFPFLLVLIFYVSYYGPTSKAPDAAAPSASAPQATAPLPRASQPAPLTIPAPVAAQSAQPALAIDAGGRTLERRAVDAVASGAYGEAAHLYDQLAEAAPNRDEAFKYREAARILRARIDAAAP
jgi:hypothetical protein